MENYTFERLEKELDNGYQIYFQYMDLNYVVYKTTENCYTQELLDFSHKSPHPRVSVITWKRLKELFPYMENIEYKTGISDI